MTNMTTHPATTGQRQQGPAWFEQLREQGRVAFERMGMPTNKLESWRFTSLRAIENTTFASPGTVEIAVTSDELARFVIEDLDAARAVFVDGVLRPELSDLGGLGEAIVLPLSEAIHRHADILQPRLGSLVGEPEDGLAALNQARMDDGLVIIVPDGVQIERAIEILSVSTAAGDEPIGWHPRHIVIAGKGSLVRVLEHSVSLRDDDQSIAQSSVSALTNSITEVFADEDAKVEHYVLERDARSAVNISTLAMLQQTRSDVHSHTVLLGGGIVRNNVQPTLAGTESHCLINGLYVGDGEQHLDNAMRVRHSAPNCKSRQYYKGIMNGRSRGVFTGRIIVDKAGQQTDAVQSNRNMLLSDDARVNARPQLEIYADDVKCTHGATTGRVDDEAVFYFRSRGLSEPVARAMLIYAFAAEGFDRMDLVPVRRLLAREMIAKLPKAQGLSIEV
jgi:Fe-S cluster assembly protein SufD